jgi:glutaredoxin 3
MAEVIEIYGKSTCQYTNAAKAELAAKGNEVRYFDVKKDEAAMARFLELSGGTRRVPLLRHADGRIEVGWGGT